MPVVALSDESRLEDLLEQDVSILGLDVMVVGRQVLTAHGKFVDLLAIDADGDLYAIELKRDRTPREVVAQVLDCWPRVKRPWGHEEISDLFTHRHKGAFGGGVRGPLRRHSMPDALNQNHHLADRCFGVDNSTERIVLYLSGEFSVPVSVLFFRCYLDGDREYLARTWLNAPSDADATVAKPGKKTVKEPWNGQDFYVTVGEGPYRNWDDEIKYGYISAGGGRKYSSSVGTSCSSALVSSPTSHRSALATSESGTAHRTRSSGDSKV